MFDSAADAAAHRHARSELVPAPIPQPHAARLWRCRCGAIEFDTYPLGVDGAGPDPAPIGRVWVTVDQLAELLDDQSDDLRSAR